MANPDRLKFNIKFPEVARGEAAFTKTIQLAKRAITDYYPPQEHPIMAERQDRIIPLERITIEPLEQVRQLEQLHKSADDIVLYRAVISAGLPEEEAKKRLYSTLVDAKYYLDLVSSDTPSLHIAQEAIDLLSSPKPEERTETAIRLGQDYIYAVFKSLPQPQPVAANVHSLIRVLAKDCLVELLTDVAKNPNVNKAVLEKVRDMMFGLLENNREGERPQFTAYGGRFMVLFPGQTITTAEFGTGFEFDIAVRCFLAVPVIQKFLDLMQANLMTNNIRYYVPSEAVKRASNSQSKLKDLDLRNRDTALDLYCTSDLPFHVIASDNPRLDIQQFLI